MRSVDERLFTLVSVTARTDWLAYQQWQLKPRLMIARSNERVNLAQIEVLSNSAPEPGRINEDAWLVLDSLEPPGYFIAAVIDGAGTRLPLPPLEDMLREHHGGLTAAAFAAGTVRTSLIAQFSAHPGASLRDALLRSNTDLQTAVADAIGGFSPELILETAGLPPDEDPRRARLALPVCVATLMRINCTTRELEYAHAGDTSLLEIRHDGTVICHTSDQMRPYNQETLQAADRLRRARDLPHMIDAINSPAIRRMDIEASLRHNYVDGQGHSQPDEGSGALNGLPELADYIECGTLTVDPSHTEAICLLTDGLELLSPLAESVTEKKERLRRMGALIRTGGLRGLYETVREMAELDSHHDQFPRVKTHDDATGVYLQLSDDV